MQDIGTSSKPLQYILAVYVNVWSYYRKCVISNTEIINFILNVDSAKANGD